MLGRLAGVPPVVWTGPSGPRLLPRGRRREGASGRARSSAPSLEPAREGSRPAAEAMLQSGTRPDAQQVLGGRSIPL